MKRKGVVLFLFLGISIIGMSQEFWLQPKKYTYTAGEEMIVDFMAGENFTGDFWDLRKHKVEKLEMHTLSSKTDLLKQVKPSMGNNLSYLFSQPGTHVLVMQSDRGYIEVEAEKFNDYLKEEGLDYILEERRNSHELNTTSKEYYTRYTKLLVQSGSKPDETFKKKAGLRFEIVPDKNPYAITSGDYLQCLVLFEGKPSAHTLIKVWSHVGNTIFLQNIYTENDGTIKFPISSKGPWMVSSVRMIHSTEDETIYHSLWTSLVFGIK